MLSAFLHRLICRLPVHPRRQLYQGLSLLNMMLAAGLLRRRRTAASPRRYVLFEHRLSGNLRSYMERVLVEEPAVEFAFLPTDPAVFLSMRGGAVRVLDRLNLFDMAWAIEADVFLSSMMARRFIDGVRRAAPGVKFVQTFHTVHVLPEPPAWFQAMNKFDLILASSPTMRDGFLVPNGVDASRVRVTGYATLDPLARPERSRDGICAEYGLDPNRSIVVYAPTLPETAAEHGMSATGIPFDLDADDFFRRVDDWADGCGTQFVLRSHPLHDLAPIADGVYRNVFVRPGNRYRNANDQLLIADALVSDLSGIAVYYSALLRPLVFVGAQRASTAAAGASMLDPEDRPGAVVTDMDGLLAALTEAVESPERYLAAHGARLRELRQRAFGDTLDGNAWRRYREEIEALLAR